MGDRIVDHEMHTQEEAIAAAAIAATQAAWENAPLASQEKIKATSEQMTDLKSAHDELVKENTKYRHDLVELKQIVAGLQADGMQVARKQHLEAPPLTEPVPPEERGQATQSFAENIQQLAQHVVHSNAELGTNVKFVREMTNANATRIDKLVNIVDKQVHAKHEAETAEAIRKRHVFQNTVQETHGVFKRTVLQNPAPKFKYKMPFLDEYETFRAWRKALNDWQAANAGAAEVHKIQECRDQFRVRKENKPNAILFWQRFEKNVRRFRKKSTLDTGVR